MWEDWIAGSLALGAMLGGLLVGDAVAAPAPSQKQPRDDVTCQEYLALNPATQQRIAYWIDDYQLAPGETTILTVAFNQLDEPILMLVADCQATPMI